MMKAKSKNTICINSVSEILNYFDEQYDELTKPLQQCGLCYLLLELNNNNVKVESYLCGLALGPLDSSSHKRQSWAITQLSNYQKRSVNARLAYVKTKRRSLSRLAKQAGIENE